jgi:hypothetical protein
LGRRKTKKRKVVRIFICMFLSGGKKPEERREVGRISLSSYYSPNFIEDLPRPLSKQSIM